MPQPCGARARLAVRFDDLALLRTCGTPQPAGRQVARRARPRFERHTAELGELAPSTATP